MFVTGDDAIRKITLGKVYDFDVRRLSFYSFSSADIKSIFKYHEMKCA